MGIAGPVGGCGQYEDSFFLLRDGRKRKAVRRYQFVWFELPDGTLPGPLQFRDLPPSYAAHTAGNDNNSGCTGLRGGRTLDVGWLPKRLTKGRSQTS